MANGDDGAFAGRRCDGEVERGNSDRAALGLWSRLCHKCLFNPRVVGQEIRTNIRRDRWGRSSQATPFSGVRLSSGNPRRPFFCVLNRDVAGEVLFHVRKQGDFSHDAARVAAGD